MAIICAYYLQNVNSDNKTCVSQNDTEYQNEIHMCITFYNFLPLILYFFTLFI